MFSSHLKPQKINLKISFFRKFFQTVHDKDVTEVTDQIEFLALIF